jgi:hypothetical protein
MEDTVSLNNFFHRRLKRRRINVKTTNSIIINNLFDSKNEWRSSERHRPSTVQKNRFADNVFVRRSVSEIFAGTLFFFLHEIFKLIRISFSVQIVKYNEDLAKKE